MLIEEENKRRRVLSGDSETESTTSVSTSTANNSLTLKQYWRKFVQTRKTPANTKKNLFHLIAEEKRKTRTLSKTSLEDGFVITTSNNLLAPNDESHVIVSRKEKLALQQQSSIQPSHSSSSRAASRFFTRIANSLRSLTQQHSTVTTNSPINTSIHSKINLPNQAPCLTTPTPTPTPVIIPLMSVFNGPINNPTEEDTQTSPLELNQNLEEASCNSDSDEESIPPSNYFASNLNKVNTGLKNSRYLSYRNSLTNSVRGSLMECSVPECREDDENTEINSGGDGNSSLNEDDEENQKSNVNRKYSNRQSRRRAQFGAQRSASYYCKSTGFKYNKDTSKQNGLSANNTNNNINNNRIDSSNTNTGVGYALPCLFNLRRFISTIEASSFYNMPINLETVEYNLKNSLIKKCSESYRKQQRLNRSETANSTLFLDYLSYLLSTRLLANKLLLALNLSFLLNIIGFLVVITNICEYCGKFELNSTQSVYVLCLIGLMSGLGRIVSTISYKVNESNAKSRIFAYVLTLILIASCLFSATVLCDTVFSFSMFAITFGMLIGI